MSELTLFSFPETRPLQHSLPQARSAYSLSKATKHLSERCLRGRKARNQQAGKRSPPKGGSLAEEHQTRLADLRASLGQLADDARESAQCANNSAAPEILDALGKNHEGLFLDGRSLRETLRNLLISLETS